MALNIQAVTDYLYTLQQRIVTQLSFVDGHAFIHDSWTRPEGGGGTSCVLEEGALFERAGVNVSQVTGSALPSSASVRRPDLAGYRYHAQGLSLVLHPRNPYIPTVHMNVRCFVALRDDADPVWWFGGGMDLTPYYGEEEDACHFHQTCRRALDPFGAALYPAYKDACDRYFFLKHRNEARGIGGIFFDDVNEDGFARCMALIQSVGDHFLPAYMPIVERRRTTPFGETERAWQAYRRGRYVEFNLVYDRGTLFGLQSGGRTESILISMPPCANWRYQYQAEPGSREAALLSEYFPVRDWAG